MILAINGAAVAQADYYIDPQSLGGNCSDNNPGSLTQPWCTWHGKFWDDRQQLAPGDTVYLRESTYGERFSFHPDSSFSGTEQAPITIRPMPGETVVFDGTIAGGNGLYVPGDNSYIHILGPLEIRNYSLCMESNGGVVNRGWLLEDLDVHSCNRGVHFRNFDGVTLRNSVVHDTNGDGVAGGVFMSSGTTNVLIENVVSHSHNDGRGVDGDGDGFWAHESTGTITLRNIVTYNNSEDGLDLKSADVLIENAQSFNNDVVGFKFWQGHYEVHRLLTYNNGEDGLKCSSATFNMTHVSSFNNVESGLQFRSTPCSGSISNSLFANNRVSAVEFGRVGSGSVVDVDFSNNLYHHDGGRVIQTCNGAGYGASDIADGTFHADIDAGMTCSPGFGSQSGSDMLSLAENPQMTAVATPPWSSSISSQTTTLTTVDQFIDAVHPWQNYAVGDWIELANDGVLRQISAVNQPTLTFSPALATPYSGRSGDGKGVRIVSWGSSAIDLTIDPRPDAGSPLVDAGVLLPSIHCPAMIGTDCVNWAGSAPDVGFFESGLELIGILFADGFELDP